MEFLLETQNLTEDTNNISEFSFRRSELENDTINQTGGGIFCNDDFNNILLECLEDGRPDVACYLFCKTQKMPKDICKQDNSGRNILHYMTIYASYGNMVIHLTTLIKKSPKNKVKKALKTIDKLGNTPIHYAAELGFNNLVKLFIDCGADPKIRNKEGYYVAEEDRSVDVSIIIASELPPTLKRLDILDNVDTVRDSAGTFKRTPEQENIFSQTHSFNTEKFINDIEKQLNKATSVNKAASVNTITEEQLIQTEDIINEILNKSKVVQPEQIQQSIQKENDNSDKMIDNIMNRISQKQSGGDPNSENSSIATENILNAIMDIKQTGGKKKSKKDKKSKKNNSKMSRISRENKISTYSEISVSPVKSDGSDISDIARQISRQSSDVHERAVIKIIEVLKLDKNKPEDVQKARNYKAAIYKIIKEKNPLLNNFDRAVEMEKSITKEFLSKIDIEKVSGEIKKHMSEKESSKKLENSTVSTSSASSTVTEKKPSKESKKTQKRVIPEFSLTSPLLSESSSELSSNESLSFSTVSTF
jgi:ankyrin repeat protein